MNAMLTVEQFAQMMENWSHYLTLPSSTTKLKMVKDRLRPIEREEFPHERPLCSGENVLESPLLPRFSVAVAELMDPPTARRPSRGQAVDKL